MPAGLMLDHLFTRVPPFGEWGLAGKALVVVALIVFNSAAWGVAAAGVMALAGTPRTRGRK
ncbi:MAG TPA: hypothetical protein VM534_08130 [Thermoanaerobaculia bacterium]|nr:hypothetical protein [Thermoanaerobaculia bacterium]